MGASGEPPSQKEVDALGDRSGRHPGAGGQVVDQSLLAVHVALGRSAAGLGDPVAVQQHQFVGGQLHGGLFEPGLRHSADQGAADVDLLDRPVRAQQQWREVSAACDQDVESAVLDGAGGPEDQCGKGRCAVLEEDLVQASQRRDRLMLHCGQ